MRCAFAYPPVQGIAALPTLTLSKADALQRAEQILPNGEGASVAGKQAWYAGTNDGLFMVERGAAGQASIASLGLQRTGGFRAPVVVDSADPARLYADGTLEPANGRATAATPVEVTG